MNPIAYTGPGFYNEDAPVFAWHLGNIDDRHSTEDAPVLKLNYHPYQSVRPGETVTELDILMCRSGPHACVRAIDTLQYGHGPMLSRVALWGGIEGDPEDKLVAQNRTHLTMCDLSPRIAEAHRANIIDAIGRSSGHRADDSATPLGAALWAILDAYLANPDATEGRVREALKSLDAADYHRNPAYQAAYYLRQLTGNPSSNLSALTEHHDLETLYRQAVGEAT